MITCDHLDAFVDGELCDREGDAFRDHLATCDLCASGLHARMMLEAAIEPHASTLRARHVPSIEVARARRRRWRIVAAALLPAAAAALLLTTWRDRDDASRVAMATSLEVASTRAIEARLAYPGADRHRPYDVARSAAPHTGEEVSLATLAKLEAAGDLHGVAAGLVLAGENDRAAQALDRAGASPDVAADRAALLVVAHRAADAIGALDAVLATHPRHAQALFNRALALRDLGLPLAAAEGFDHVAELGEPGWSDEARARAMALRAHADERRGAWERAKRAGLVMMRGGPPPDDATVRETPELARHYLYHAVRAATSRERAQSLAPLATTLDGLAGGRTLSAFMARTVARDFNKRAPLAETYARLVESATSVDVDAQRAYLAKLRRAGETDLLLGAMALVDPSLVDAHEYAQLAEASGDAWWIAMAARATAASELRRGDYARAEATLRRAEDACASAHAEWRCAGVEYELAGLLARASRTVDARNVALLGLARSRASAFEMESRFVYRLGDVARVEGVLPLVRAYVREAALAAPDDCEAQRIAHEEMAAADVASLDRAGATNELRARPRCAHPITLLSADSLVEVVRMGGAPDDAQTLAADLEEYAATLPPGDRAYGEVLEARLALADGSGRGVDIARRAIARASETPESDESARNAEMLAHLTLAVEAARAARSDEALDEIAAAARVDARLASGACVIGVAVDGEKLLGVARDEWGHARAEMNTRAAADVDASAIVSPSLRAQIAGCASVRVIALPPLHGLPGLLAPHVAWAYASATPSPAAASPSRRVVISDVAPPPALRLPPLADWTHEARGETILRGPSATPARALAEIADASEIEIHAHGFVDATQSPASLLALSPDDTGRYALSAADLASGTLRGRPIVVLGACHAARTATYFHKAWSLPVAFVRAGARAVLASTSEIRDAEAGPFFDAILARIRAGASPSVALRDERVERLARDPASWVKDVIEFE